MSERILLRRRYGRLGLYLSLVFFLQGVLLVSWFPEAKAGASNIQIRSSQTKGNVKSRTSTSSQDGRNSSVAELEPVESDDSVATLEPFSEEANCVESWLDPKLSSFMREQALDWARESRKHWIPLPKLQEDRLNDLKIRRLSSGRVSLYTDLPSNREVDQIPEVLDSAVSLICDFFQVDRKLFENWHVDAFLMRNLDAFKSFGAFDDRLLFVYGCSDRERIYVKDQEVSYYNRFLLTHELVHMFMREYFGDLRPYWFAEGIAEYIALHSWTSEDGLQLAQIPVSVSDYPGFERLRNIQEILKTHRAPTLFDILYFEPKGMNADVSTYAWNWAFVMFLYNSPKYQSIAELIPYWSQLNNPNALFVNAIGERWGELEYDWADFLEQIDYSYDFKGTAVVNSPLLAEEPSEEELLKGVVVSVDSSRGWQATGITLEAHKKYKLTIAGRFECFLQTAKRRFSVEGTGATCEYSGGRPVGRVRAVVASIPEKATMAQVYGVSSESSLLEFPFNMTPNSWRSRFGSDGTTDFSGFSQEKLAKITDQSTIPNNDKKNGNNRARNRNTQGTRTDLVLSVTYPIYNALYPWGDSIDFSSNATTIVPDETGELYLRVNSAPCHQAKNSGVVKTQVKLLK